MTTSKLQLLLITIGLIGLASCQFNTGGSTTTSSGTNYCTTTPRCATCNQYKGRRVLQYVAPSQTSA